MKFVSCRQSLSHLYLRLLVDGSDVGGTGGWRCELLVAVRARIRLQNIKTKTLISEYHSYFIGQCVCCAFSPVCTTVCLAKSLVDTNAVPQ